MALLTYADLSAAVGRWANRADLAARIPEFIDLADERVRRMQEWDRRVYSTENAGVPFTVTSQGMELPVTVQTIKDAWPASGSALRPLGQVSFAALRSSAHTNADAAGTPQQYALLPGRGDVEGPRIFLWPQTTDFDIDFAYVHDVGKLTSPENDLFRYSPGVYLFAALAELAPYLKHDERAATWEQKFLSALAELNNQAERAQFGATNTVPYIPAIG